MITAKLAILIADFARDAISLLPERPVTVPEFASGGQRGEALPIEMDAVAGPCGRQRLAVFEHQRMLDIAIETEPMRLEIGAVRTSCEQMHGNVMRAVAGHRKIERLGTVGRDIRIAGTVEKPQRSQAEPFRHLQIEKIGFLENTYRII